MTPADARARPSQLAAHGDQWGTDPAAAIEATILTVLGKSGSLKQRDLFQKSKRRKIKTSLRNEARRAPRDAGPIGHDPTGIHDLAETVPGM